MDKGISSREIKSSNSTAKLTKLLLRITLIWCLTNCPPSESRGGGSKRTFSSSKSQSSQPSQQNLDNCVDPSNCINQNSLDQSWYSVVGALLALIAPLSVLFTFILLIKFCFINIYPKGYHEIVVDRQYSDANEKDISEEIDGKGIEVIRNSLDHQHQ